MAARQLFRTASACARDLIKRFVEARDHITVWGDATPVREFLCVADAAEAIARAIPMQAMPAEYPERRDFAVTCPTKPADPIRAKLHWHGWGRC